MAAKSSGLGRGLGDLFARTDGDESAPLKDGSTFAEIDLDQISPNPHQPRTVFNEDDLDELSASIAEFGVLQPVVVRKSGVNSYELIMGERRWRASRQAGKKTIPAIIRGTEDSNLLRDALIENLHRADLNPIEEALAYEQLLQDFECTKEELSQRIHRSRPQISNTLRLLNLPATIQRKVGAGVLSAGHARALLGLHNASTQERIADRIIAEGLSVRAVEELVAAENKPARVSSVRGPRRLSDREQELSTQLTDYFDTQVKVNIGRNKGKITIEFATGEDLERIMAILNHETI